MPWPPQMLTLRRSRAMAHRPQILAPQWSQNQVHGRRRTPVFTTGFVPFARMVAYLTDKKALGPFFFGAAQVAITLRIHIPNFKTAAKITTAEEQGSHSCERPRDHAETKGPKSDPATIEWVPDEADVDAVTSGDASLGSGWRLESRIFHHPGFLLLRL